MATKTKNRPPRKGPIQRPKQRPTPSRRWWPYLAVAAGIIALVAVPVVATLNQGGSTASASAGLPNTPDYHSLLVNPADPQQLVLGTHGGLYVSSDGGRHWRFDALAGNDAMNLARPGGDTIWLAGHNVFKKSSDGGTTWSDVRPSGLPGLDIHGFAVDPRDPARLYAAVAGRGLFRSIDGGTSFTLVSKDVGGGVMALAVTADGLLAGDMEQGLLMSADSGMTWRVVLRAQVMGLAVNPSDADRILAAGPGVLLSADGGGKWKLALPISQGAGPVAWSPSDPKIAYAVGFNRTLYRTVDGGITWPPVS